MKRVALILFLFVLLMNGRHSGNQPPATFDSLSVRARALSAAEVGDLASYGPLRLTGAWQLTGSHPAFGGFSSLVVSDDGALVALNDTGELFGFRVSGERGQGFVKPLPRVGLEQGWPSWKWDSESMQRDPVTGRSWVGFEFLQRICRYAPDFKALEGCVEPPAVRNWPLTGGMESLVRFGDGRFMTISEMGTTKNGAHDVVLWRGDPVDPATPPPVHLGYRPPTGYRPTDALWLGGDKLLILNGRLTLANPRLSTLWRLPTNLLDTKPHIDQIVEAVARALPEDGAILWRDLKRSIVDLNPTRTDTHGRITRADGKMLDYAITRLPDGQTMMTFVDVTESANYQNVLKERNEALVTADRLKDAFVQNVSYELRSPLTNIIGFVVKQKSYTDYIRASSVTLGVLIDNILDLATVDAGIAQMRPEPQDVPALIEKAKAGLAATFPDIDGEEPLNIEIDIPEELPVLYADGTRIVQILYNLLSTAARFTEPGGKVRLSVIPRGERMIFTVEDDGTQMTDEMRAALSDRSDAAATSARHRGAGLGLAIVRSFVHLHGGTISVERREPRGSRVVVSLPLAAALTTAAE